MSNRGVTIALITGGTVAFVALLITGAWLYNESRWRQWPEVPANQPEQTPRSGYTQWPGPVRAGDLEFTGTGAEMQELTSKKYRQLVITFWVKNLSASRKFTMYEWNVDGRDAAGNHYGNSNVLVRIVPGHRKVSSLYPGEQTTDVIALDRPVDEKAELLLDIKEQLPGMQDEPFRLLIPAGLIKSETK